MSILHRRAQSRELARERAANPERESRAAEYPRASKSKPVPADVKARTWIDPNAPESAPAAAPASPSASGRRAPAKGKRAKGKRAR